MLAGRSGDLLGRRSGNRFSEIEALVLLRFAEVRRVEQLLQANDLRSLVSSLADVGVRRSDVLVDVVGDGFLNDSDGE